MSKKKKHKRTATSTLPIPDTANTQGVMLWAVASMARRGPQILADLRTTLGMEPSSGHVVDVLMNSAAAAERAALAGDAAAFVNALLVTQFLARDLAYKQGKINTADLAPADTTH